MSDRLNELRRQRTVIQAHLAWLDREIVAEQERGGIVGEMMSRSPSVDAPRTIFPTSPAAESSVVVEPGPETLLTTLSAVDQAKQALPKTGCWIIFSICLLTFVGVVITVLYVFYR